MNDDIDVDMDISIMGMSLYNDIFVGAYSNAVIGGENSKLKVCNNMGFESIDEYINAYDEYVNIGSAHRLAMFPDDNQNLPNYLIEWKYFDHIYDIDIGGWRYNIDELLSSSLYDNYLKSFDSRGCMFLIRPTSETLARLYGKGDMYNRLAWICEDYVG